MMQPILKQRQTSLLFRILQKSVLPRKPEFGTLMKNSGLSTTHNSIASFVTQMRTRSISHPSDRAILGTENFQKSDMVAVLMKGLPFRCTYGEVKDFFKAFEYLKDSVEFGIN